jgi:hypothetical protein
MKPGTCFGRVAFEWQTPSRTDAPGPGDLPRDGPLGATPTWEAGPGLARHSAHIGRATSCHAGLLRVTNPPGQGSSASTGRILARAFVYPRAVSNAKNSQLRSPGFPALAGSWATMRSASWGHGWHLACGARIFATPLPDPMYRTTCPSRRRLCAPRCSPAIVMHRIIGRYPVASPAHRCSQKQNSG